MAEKACHVFASATQVGLTQVLGGGKSNLVYWVGCSRLWNQLRRIDFIASDGIASVSFCSPPANWQMLGF
jgi:hypothetical protein